MILHGNLSNIPFDTVLLDFDGVISDTETVFARFDCDLLNDVLRKAGKIPDLTYAYLRTLAGLSGEEKLEKIAKEKDIPAEKYINDFIKDRDQRRPDLFKSHKPALSPGLLGLLKHYDNRYALATNKTRDKIEADLLAIEVMPYFQGRIFCYENDLQKKPAPDILLYSAAETGMAPKATIYIGDNKNDMVAAKAADMIAAGFIMPSPALIDSEEHTARLIKAGADIIIDDLSDLIPPFSHQSE